MKSHISIVKSCWVTMTLLRVDCCGWKCENEITIIFSLNLPWSRKSMINFSSNLLPTYAFLSIFSRLTKNIFQNVWFRRINRRYHQLYCTNPDTAQYYWRSMGRLTCTSYFIVFPRQNTKRSQRNFAPRRTPGGRPRGHLRRIIFVHIGYV